MLKAFSKIFGLVLLLALVAAGTFAQTKGLPRLRKGENYRAVRVKMLKAGWKPFHAPDADQCQPGDARCAGRPEMQSCAGTGAANCRFLWKRRGKTVAIFTVGEAPARYSGFDFLN